MKIVSDEWFEVVSSDVEPFNPDRVAFFLNRIADDIDGSDNPSRSQIYRRLCALARGIQRNIALTYDNTTGLVSLQNSNRRIAAYNRRHRDIPTHFITIVTDNEEYRRALYAVTTGIRKPVIGLSPRVLCRQE